MVLPLCGFLILTDPFSSGLSLLYLALSHLPSSNFERLAPTHPVTAFRERQTKPTQQIPTMKGEKISKKIMVKAPSFAFYTLLCKKTPCELE